MRQQVRIVTHRNTSGNLSIRLRCMIGAKYYDIATGISLLPSEWNTRRQRVNTTHPDFKPLNAQLDSLVDSVTQYLAANPDATIAALRAAVSDKTKGADTCSADDLYDALNAFISTESKRNTWSDGTTKRFHSLGASLSALFPVLHLSTLSAAILDKYIDLRSRQGNNNTTIAKDIHLIRWFLRWCAEVGRYDGNLHNTYAPHLKGANYEYKEVIFLTLDELRRVEDADLPPYLSNVRDVFVFCCYTGLRFSDAAKLRKSDLHGTYIEVVTQKTDKRIRIELNKHSAAILERHKGMEYAKNAALPVLTNQYTNIALKRIGELCEINEPIRIVKYSGRQRIETTAPKYELLTTHCARRTFVVTALQLGIPIEVITRWTGHSDLKALKPYVAIVDELKARNMSKFDVI